MTVHFFYNFKEDLIEKIKSDYEDELIKRKENMREQKQLDDAGKIILDYFKIIRNALSEIIEVSNGKIKYEESAGYLVKFTIGKNSLRFLRKEKSIQVKVELYIKEADIVESKILGNIVIGTKVAMVKEIGKLHTGSHFDENTINYYMRIAFGDFTNFK
jgi:hypothetical protein